MHPVPSFQSTLLVQQTILGQVLVSSSTPSLSGHNVSPPRGKNPNIPLVLGETNMSGLQTHMVGFNQPYSGGIPNPVGPSGSGNIQYQQPYMAQFPFQQAYVPYGSQSLVNLSYIPQAGDYVSPGQSVIPSGYGQIQFGNYQYPQGISQGTIQQPL